MENFKYDWEGKMFRIKAGDKPVTINLPSMQTIGGETTLEDKFAMAALTGLLSNSGIVPEGDKIADYTRESYKIAKAMMEARNEK